ncbi:uncharacterized protein L969DRAFT_95030 [Mixia osmundae IAM 14324]|uniref:DUF2415 domain-containing protein n=1 Tax=Mixia osmundae (strain CBS 9802 / IAM 14324 / JCM 22182 / KY 12970) TaxID=764103 RepID=G7E0Z5_MIXOS|nr:uncharacterized protein L969DRAFT_95030 [Mixia osmundae IAM 14324]KEI38860.1 hypothetical protein L969DRAFT_95030 [Mixia osmundae IAM 14324]GAA96505.1 hypothetical protein E5Q_03173 [Mixia osmundae IAM 14324]
MARLVADDGPRGDAAEFWRSAEWCPDGTSFLAASERRRLSLFALPASLYSEPASVEELTPHTTRSFPAALLSYAWYPYASATRPDTFCYATSVRDEPIRLNDAPSTKIRASYPLVDHRERYCAAQSLAFSPDGTMLYAGLESSVAVIDIARPGDEPLDYLDLAPDSGTFKGPSGLVSALAFSPHNPELLAVGTLGPIHRSLAQAGIYDLTTSKLCLTLPPRLAKAQRSQAHQYGGTGITSLSFSVLDPNLLVSTARQCDLVLLWDIRNPSHPIDEGTTTRVLSRNGKTNQRLGLDVSKREPRMMLGDADGHVSVHEVTTQEAVYGFEASREAIGSAHFHPYLPLALITTGERHFSDSLCSDDDSESENESEAEAKLASSLQIWKL